MKRIILICFFIAAGLTYVNAQQTKDAVIIELIGDVLTVNSGEISPYSPISSFNKLAGAKADKSIILTKENIQESLNEAQNYGSCFITVGTHTIVRVTNFKASVKSGSWGVNMPYGKGFVQKGDLTTKEGYINNIIGTPDSQRRIMFLFK